MLKFNRSRRADHLPGFRLHLVLAIAFLGFFVLLPVAALLAKSISMGPSFFWQTITDARAVASYRVTVSAAIEATIFNSFFGLLMAWILVRYDFFGRGFLDAMVDLPFALPTSVSGLALATLFSTKGWLGEPLKHLHIKVAYAPLGIAVAMAFTGVPFVIRSVQPVLASLEADVEEAAETLGASSFAIFRRIIFPAILPALATGATLAFGRAIGEFGAVIFIAGNVPYKTEITALLTYTHLDEFDYAGSAAIATVMLLLSFAVMVAADYLEGWGRKWAQP
ncbi:MAG TPA: sulfate ABC transporter permease subunit CysT [Opitutaceae bacterium]